MYLGPPRSLLPLPGHSPHTGAAVGPASLGAGTGEYWVPNSFGQQRAVAAVHLRADSQWRMRTDAGFAMLAEVLCSVYEEYNV